MRLARSVRSKSTFQRVWPPPCERKKRKGYVEVVRLSEALRVNGCDASNIHATEKRRRLNIQLSGTIMLYTTEDGRGAIFVIKIIIIRGVCTQRSKRGSNSGRICLAKEGWIDWNNWTDELLAGTQVALYMSQRRMYKGH